MTKVSSLNFVAREKEEARSIDADPNIPENCKIK